MTLPGLLDVVSPLDQVCGWDTGPTLLVVGASGKEPTAGGLGQGGEGSNGVGLDAALDEETIGQEGRWSFIGDL